MTERDEEEHDPGDTQLEKELHVEFADARVEIDAHEEVVHEVAAAAVGAFVDEGERPNEERYNVARYDCN